MTTTLQAALGAPFPGLRAFEAEEALLFYGREAHVAELLDRLGDSHFVAVTGTSGSGKSSLVRAGLRPALHRGYLVDASSRWRFVTMRPGGAPLENMAAALASTFDASLEDLLPSLRSTSAGLSQAVARAGLGSGESLLIIADQFEELFRFDVTRAQQSDAALFVSQLLEATEQRAVAVYVVVTMRSEFLGRCSEFSGLAEAFNRSQYLVPRLTRDERREAIERPLRLVGTTPSPSLVQQVLNDAGDDPDQLPVLQHVLLRTYREWERSGATGRLELAHYERVGGIERALDVHGNEILAELSEPAQRTAATLFRGLTVAQGGVALRRPRRMQQLYDVAGAQSAEARRQVDDIVGRFARRDNSFLMLSSRELAPATVVDITHESLIRKWNKLEAWVREETRSAEWYADLSRDVLRYRSGEVSLWQDPELAGVQKRRTDEGWNEAWANQYRKTGDPEYAEVLTFLGASVCAAAAAVRAKRVRLVLGALGVVLAVATAVVGYRLIQAQQRAAEFEARSAEAAAAQNDANARLARLEAQFAEAARASTGSGADAASQKARLDALTAEITAARAQAKGSQDELFKLKKAQELQQLDRGGLLKQIDALTQERDRLRQQLGAYQNPAQQKAPSSPATQRPADDAGRTAANAADDVGRRTDGTPVAASAATAAAARPVPTAQELTKAFTDGVRAFELKNYRAASSSLQLAAEQERDMRARSTQTPPSQVRLSGTRFVPFSPYSYLAATLYELKDDCPGIGSALDAASREPVPAEIKRQLDAARKACP
jgi:hypothetical protein